MKHDKINGIYGTGTIHAAAPAFRAIILWIFALLLTPITARAQTYVNVNTFDELRSIINSSGNATDDMIISVTAGFPITANLDIPWSTYGKSITIRSVNPQNPVVLTRGFASSLIDLEFGALFTVNSGTKIILEDIIIDGDKDAYTNYGSSLITVIGGEFIMKNGAVLTNSSSLSNSAGIWVSSGTFTMEGGEISRNTGASYGVFSASGAVCVDWEGNFTMHGGVIIHNTSDYGGSVYTGGTFTMTGGEIKNNNTDNNGGGVFSVGTFTMTGGEISNNTANRGGGVYVVSGTFTMESGEISGNNSTVTNEPYTNGGGGGVYVYDGMFTMTGGEISSNTADDGSGLFLGDGTFTMRGGEISGNTASGYGGGVYTWSGTFTMEDGEISGNTANNGGGVSVGGSGYVGEPTFTMSGGKINGNTAMTSGGGVYANATATLTINDGELTGNSADFGGGMHIGSIPGVNGPKPFTMNGGKISNNTAYTAGGGVYATSMYTVATSFTLNGGEISGNSASFGGGLYSNAGTVVIGGTAVISGNSASNGGGVYGGSLNMTGGEIIRNTASGNGGGVHVSSGAFSMTSGEISGNTAYGGNGGGVYMSGGTFTLGGTAVINSNTYNNAYLANGRYITLSTSARPAPAMIVGVRTETPSGVIVNSGAREEDAAYFRADEPGKICFFENNQLVIKEDIPDEPIVNPGDYFFWAAANPNTLNIDNTGVLRDNKATLHIRIMNNPRPPSGGFNYTPEELEALAIKNV